MSENFIPERAGTILADCVSSVFADMAFIDVAREHQVSEQAAGDSVHNPEKERRAAIDVLSPLSCRIELKINTSTKDRIFDTLFAGSPGAGIKNDSEDPLLEMLNVIAGMFLSAYFGPGTDIQLELPRYLYLGEVSPGQTVSAIVMSAEGEPLEAAISSVRYRY